MKIKVLILCLAGLALTALGQQPQPPQRATLTADQVFEGVKSDIGNCTVEKSTTQAALNVEQSYSRQLEAENAKLKAELAALKSSTSLDSKLKDSKEKAN